MLPAPGVPPTTKLANHELTVELILSKLEYNAGHGAFYSANPAWTEKIASWAMAAPAPTN